MMAPVTTFAFSTVPTPCATQPALEERNPGLFWKRLALLMARCGCVEGALNQMQVTTMAVGVPATTVPLPPDTVQVWPEG